MFGIDTQKIYDSIYTATISNIELYAPKVMGAFIILLIGIFIAIVVHKIVLYIFKKFKIIELVDKLNINFESTTKKTAQASNESTEEEGKAIRIPKISDKIKIDRITAKASSYYIFLVFFRLAVVFIGITEVEKFMSNLLDYLPSLFIAVVIGFFGIRFAGFIYDVVYHTLSLSKQKTAKIIASGAEIIILFFTLMVVLSHIGIGELIINTILIGFISMLTIAGGLAFGLGGRDIASEILESFRK